MSKSRYVVTITRQFGSMGRPIAKKIAEKLGVEYYDRDLVDKAAEKLNLPVSTVKAEEETAKKKKSNPFRYMEYPMGGGTTATQEKIFEAQKNIIQFLAEKDTCVIVGRCSDFVLSEMENAVHIYIYASNEARLKHCMEDLGMEEGEARRMIVSVDEAREAYHMNFAGYKPDDKRFKDIMIDSSFLGVEGTADYLVQAIRQKFDLG
ncbi:MAG: cytidylate kinase-like family protein [Lachnospiraceae bacterium]|nr:cytidylate kinase-like family protein [Lachnospiraceae bacterium]